MATPLLVEPCAPRFYYTYADGRTESDGWTDVDEKNLQKNSSKDIRQKNRQKTWLKKFFKKLHQKNSSKKFVKKIRQYHKYQK